MSLVIEALDYVSGVSNQLAMNTLPKERVFRSQAYVVSDYGPHHSLISNKEYPASAIHVVCILWESRRFKYSQYHINSGQWFFPSIVPDAHENTLHLKV